MKSSISYNIAMLPTSPTYSEFPDMRASPTFQLNGFANLIGTITCFSETEDLISLPTEKECFLTVTALGV